MTRTNRKQYKKELSVAKTIARKAGVIMRKYFYARNQHLERKKDDSPVTIADKKVNSLVIREISRIFNEGVVGEEESSTSYGMGRKWFCDPIDGTKAFIWGTPTAMFSLALVIDGVPVVGVAYDPFLDMLYEGVKGRGSYCNGKRLRVSSRDIKGECIAVTSSVGKLIKDSRYAKILLRQKARFATFSGAVYKSCLVARGKFAGYLGADVGAHDMAAVQVIVEEAGGRVTGYNGKKLDYSKPFKSAVVSNAVVHKKLLNSLKKTKK